MSRKGNCWDNTVTKSFFGTLKQERVQWRHYQTQQEAMANIREYIVMYYNEERLHSYLGYISSNDCEREFYRLQKPLNWTGSICLTTSQLGSYGYHYWMKDWDFYSKIIQQCSKILFNTCLEKNMQILQP